ncbi:MAG: EAL domain-containing protein, partial [Zoogloeaceae bacterium]|nr:EAL domain-containing protein [Zoogloeaceae bacterium]
MKRFSGLHIHSFRTRLLLSSLLVSILTLFLLIGNNLLLTNRYFQTEQSEYALEQGKIFGEVFAPYLLTHDYATLRDMLDNLRQNQGLIYIVVVDEDGDRAAAVGWPEDQALPAGEANDDGVLHAVFPIAIEDVVYGQLYIGRSTSYSAEARQELLEQSALIGLGGVSLLVFFLYIVIYYMTQGLVRLSEASHRISMGDFARRVQVKGQNEISVLAANFNRMIDAVQNRIRALEDSEQRFRAIADYTYDWENWFDTDGKLRWVNPAVQRVTGFSPEECMDMEQFPLNLVHVDDQELIRHQIRQAQDGHSGQNMEFRILRRDGHCLWCAMSWQSIRDKHGASQGYRSSIRDITLQHHATEELAYQSIHDPLTGLYNRRAFERQLRQAIEQFQQDHRLVSVLYLDLDQFKVINDTCGHIAGDQLLINLTKTLQTNVRQGFLARLGGDEFGILLRDCDETEAMRHANALVSEIRAYTFTYGGRSFRIGASVGVVRVIPGMNSFTDILMAADTACYAAKEQGRNRVELYDENNEYFRMRHEEFRSIGHITTALSEGRFLLYFQRLKPLRDEQPEHVEILIRLRDFLGNIQTPARFIAAAERFNLMPYIDRWVVENVCRQLAEWQKAGLTPAVEHFAINISGASLSDREFPDYVHEQIERYQVDASRLCFEITESCAVGQLAQALNFIKRIRGLKASLSLDDFGSGLSSFAYLKQFRVDYLKIDGLFIANIDNDSSDRAVVQAIVQLAKVHGLKVIAEFVSSESILEVVRELGIDYAQGYARHVPEPLEHLVGGGGAPPPTPPTPPPRPPPPPP